MIKVIEIITKQTYESQNQHLRFFARVDLSMKLQILQLQKPLFHKLKSTYTDVDNAVLTLASLILAIATVAKELDDVKKQFDVYKAKMESLLISQLEMLKEIKED